MMTAVRPHLVIGPGGSVGCCERYASSTSRHGLRGGMHRHRPGSPYGHHCIGVLGLGREGRVHAVESGLAIRESARACPHALP